MNGSTQTNEWSCIVYNICFNTGESQAHFFLSFWLNADDLIFLTWTKCGSLWPAAGEVDVAL